MYDVCMMYVLGSRHRPDITVMVDWELKINYLSIYLCSRHLSGLLVTTTMFKMDGLGLAGHVH